MLDHALGDHRRAGKFGFSLQHFFLLRERALGGVADHRIEDVFLAEPDEQPRLRAEYFVGTISVSRMPMSAIARKMRSIIPFERHSCSTVSAGPSFTRSLPGTALAMRVRDRHSCALGLPLVPGFDAQNTRFQWLTVQVSPAPLKNRLSIPGDTLFPCRASAFSPVLALLA